MFTFYTPDIDGKIYQLSEEESKHCIKVLRLGIQSTVFLVDGVGGFYQAEIIDNHPKRTVLKVVNFQKEYQKRNHYLHIAIAPTKNIDRFEWFLEKATEIGIDEVTPIICERSERKELKIERSVKIITAAVKQSKKAYHPILNPAVRFKSFVENKREVINFIAYCKNDVDKKFIQHEFIPKQSYTVIIGPEGDFTDEEIEFSFKNNFKGITLGNSILRTETAALTACFEINLLNR